MLNADYTSCASFGKRPFAYLNELIELFTTVDVKPVPGPSTSKEMDEAADDLHDPEDPLSPEYVPKPPPEHERKVKLESTEGSNGEPAGLVEKVEDHDIDDGDDFDEDEGTNPLEPDVQLGGDEEEEGGESSAAMFSSGGHFLNGGDDDEDDDGEGGGDQVFI